MSEQLTYERAEKEVEQYVKAKGKMRSHLTAKSICRAAEVEPDEHNRRRIHHVLRRKFERDDEASSSTVRYKVKR